MATDPIRDLLDGKIDLAEARRQLFPPTNAIVIAVICLVCSEPVDDVERLGIRDDSHQDEVVAALRAAWFRNWQASGDCGHLAAHIDTEEEKS